MSLYVLSLWMRWNSFIIILSLIGFNVVSFNTSWCISLWPTIIWTYHDYFDQCNFSLPKPFLSSQYHTKFKIRNMNMSYIIFIIFFVGILYILYLNINISLIYTPPWFSTMHRIQHVGYLLPMMIGMVGVVGTKIWHLTPIYYIASPKIGHGLLFTYLFVEREFGIVGVK